MRTDQASDPVRKDLAAIRGYVASLAARERRVLVLRGALRGLVSVAAASFAAVALPLAGFDRPTAIFLIVAGFGAGVWWAFVPVAAEARASRRDPLRPARLVEAQAPALRGMLLTAVDAATRSPETASPLAGAVAARALSGVAPWPPGRVHPLRPLVTPGLAIGLGWVAVAASLLLSPLGPAGTFRWWMRAITADQALAALVPEALAPEARVGDLVLRYTYPTYTGLEPKEIPNSTGDVSAPPGTSVEVSARSAQVVEAAGLLVYEEPLEAELGDAGRAIGGRFQVRTEPGEWKFVTWRAGQSLESRAFAIVPEPDLPPDVTVDLEGDQLEVSLDQPLALPWRARDDFGVRTVGVEIDGKEAGRPLFRAEGRRAEVAEVLAMRPVDLGLKAGDRVRMTVTAWDNDTVSGSKPGRSRAIDVVVVGARGRAELAALRHQELLRLMLPILAHFLVEDFPPGGTAGRLASWGETVAGRYRPLSESVDRMWATARVQDVERQIVGSVLASGTELIRYTQIGFEPGSSKVVPTAALESTGALRDEAIVALEDAIAYFDRIIRNRALAEAVEAALALAEAAERLDEAAADGDPHRMFAALDAQREATRRLAEASEQLVEGGLRDTITQRTGELDAIHDTVRERAAEGQPEAASRLAGRMADLMRDLAASVKAELDKAQSRSDDAMQAANALLEELARIEEEQRALQSQVEELRALQDAEEARRTSQIWSELERRTAELGAHGAAVADGLERADRPFFEQERARAARDSADALRQSVEARDVRGALQEAMRSEMLWQTLEITASREDRRGGPGAAEMGAGLAQTEAIARLLEQLEQAGALDPSLAELQAAQARQDELSRDADAARRAGRALAQDFPVSLRDVDEEIAAAEERMDQAGQQLGQGRAMQAEGEQSVAADRTAAARRALELAIEQAMQQAAQLSGQGGEGGGTSEQEDGEGEGSDGGADPSPEEQVEIPAPEEFRTPEEYRGALLQGMEGDVPEEYRALKKRYYEELVAQ